MTFAFYATLTFFIVLCVLFAGLILIQKGRGGGISAAFGGAGGNTAFGSKTGDVLTWATSVVFGLFLFLCVALNLMANKIDQTARGVIQTAPAAQAGNENLVPATQPSTPIGPINAETASTQPGAIVNPTNPSLDTATQPTK